MSFIDSGKSQGATVHLGGERFGTEGYFIKPTIFTDVKKDMKIVQEEIFGPVGVIIKFDNDEDVIHQANDTVYGLAASVFTKNIDRALRTSQKLRAGSLWVSAHCCHIFLLAGRPVAAGASLSCNGYPYMVACLCV